MSALQALQKITLSLFVVLICGLTLSLALLGTETGCRLLIRALPRAGLDVSVERSEGSLLEQLTLHGFVYTGEGQRITADTFRFGWHASKLLRGIVHIDTITAQGLSVDTFETDESTNATPFALPAMPLSILIDKLDLQKLHYRNGEQHLRIDRLSSRIALQNHRLRLSSLTLEMPEAVVDGFADIELHNSFPLTAQWAWSLKLPDTPPLSGDLTMFGSLSELWLTGATDGFINLQHQARLNLAENIPTFTVSGRWQHVQWPLTGQPDLTGKQGDFNIAGSADNYRIDLNTRLNTEQQIAQLRLTGRGNTESLTLDKLELTPEQGQLTLQGRIVWAEEPVNFALTGAWQNLRWPSTGPAQLETAQGQFDFSGTLDDYHIQLTSKLALEALPPFDVALTGQGNTEALRLENLSLRPKRGRLDLHGNIAWVDTVDFAVKLDAQKINPGDFTRDMPGSINLKASASGRLAEQALVRADLDIERFDGSIFGAPLAGRGQLTYADERLTIDQLRLQSADNRISANGILALEQSHLKFSIDAPHLAQVWPGLAGSIQGAGLLLGAYRQPSVKADLSISKLRYRDDRIDQLDLHIDYAESSNKDSHLDLALQNLMIEGHTIDRLTLNGSGLPARHRIEMTVSSDTLSADTSLSGGLNNARWGGVAERLAIGTEQQSWQIEKPWRFTLDFNEKDAVAIDLPLNCLVHASSAFCLNAEGSPQQLSVDAEARTIDIDLFKAWLPENLRLSGMLNANATLIKRGEYLSADGEASLVEASADLVQSPKTAVTLPLTETRLTARYRGDRLDTDIRIGLTGQDFMTAQLQAGMNDRSLLGNLQASVVDLSLVDAFVEDIENLQGRLTADLTLTGRIDRPELGGLIQLNGTELDIPEIGIHPHDIDIRISALPGHDRVALSGRLDSGQGSLYLDGDLIINPAAGFPVELLVTGSDFEIARMPEAVISVSPQLTIRQNQNTFRVDGDVAVDKAELRLIELPDNAVAPSPDEIILGAQSNNTAESDLNWMTDLQITLGDHTHFSGYGLNTGLTGKLRYTASPGKQRLQGRLAMKDAQYKAYGQDLMISKGEFLFNGPFDNPWLNVEATRRATDENVTAILRVTGPLQSPKSKVSSQPSLPESDALAYLLTGRSLQRVGQSQSDALAKAALSYGAGELSWLSNQLGFDQFEVEEAKRLEDTALRLGKYINPDLYLGLSLGLFSNTYAVILKQKLNNHFSLETRAGESQRIDLKYRLERD